MLGDLAILSGVAAILPVVIFVLLAKRGQSREILKYALTGFIVALIDFVVEYFGTSTATWTYHQSLYLILGAIPIELPLLFFSGSVVARFLFLNINKIKIPFRLNVILYVLMLASALAYAREAYLGHYPGNIHIVLTV